MPDKAKITKEDIELFESGKKNLEDFSAEQKAQLELLASGEEVEIDGLGTDGAEAAATQPAKQGEPPKDYVPGDKYKEKANEANTFKQQVLSYKEKIEKITSELEELKSKQSELPAGIATAAGTQELVQRLARLESMAQEGNKKAIQKSEEVVNELRQKMAFAEVDALAVDYPELNLGISFEKANEGYADFYEKVGGTIDAVDKYFSDKEFRSEMEKKGVKAPPYYEKLQEVLEIYSNRDKYPSLEDAYLGTLNKKGKLKQRFSSEYTKGVTDAVRKIAENKQETTILAPDGAGSSGEMSEESMMNWLAAHPYPKTAEEQAVMTRIQSYLESQSR